jgi:hypothetical protein
MFSYHIVIFEAGKSNVLQYQVEIVVCLSLSKKIE